MIIPTTFYSQNDHAGKHFSFLSVTDVKNKNYILDVARSWASEGTVPKQSASARTATNSEL